jgi:hypothetical protein
MRTGPIYLSCDPADAGFMQSLRTALSASAVMTVENCMSAIATAARFVAFFSAQFGGGVRHNAEELSLALDHHRQGAATASARPWLMAVKLSACDLSFIPVPAAEIETIEFPVSSEELQLHIAGVDARQGVRAATEVNVDDLCVDEDVNITTFSGSSNVPKELDARSELRARRVAVGGSLNFTTARTDEPAKKGQ